LRRDALVALLGIALVAVLLVFVWWWEESRGRGSQRRNYRPHGLLWEISDAGSFERLP
jgi:hypothetical protein